ncbi:RagB/SusD family nutrient uptake outer membrane protein [Joostella atrarenae]|uniref:RagB/SusD family nutrient uptake outer membrane protein n=1 Tax=Joostella atrarenae TaxID=679257 RepID=A0ABS9J083_9FLAO|nr:RagB/SusD family nutrient uptake outer membrane protein [Joostella atrarenae]MCF8713845.1 RagB/SusD family nutrient uptake outer membrane protein [Joostella atrarenae]
MKRNIKIYTLLLISVFVLSSCNEFLDEVPDNRTEIDSADKIGELLVGAYPEASYFMIAESMSDNAIDLGSANTTDVDVNTIMYNWEDTNLDTRDTPTFYWNACYAAIAQANQALKAIEELEGGNDLSAYRGEALLARAYAHFMLVNLWGKAYDSNTAATDLGVPYVLEPEVEVLQDYERNTVEEVYELIEADLLEGLPLITNDYFEAKFHFTQDAANTFASRFYLFKGEWDKVVTYASKALSANPADNIRDWNFYRALTYDETRIRHQASVEPTNLLIVGASSLYARQYALGRYGLSSAHRGEIFTTDTPLNKSWAYRVFNFSSTRYFVPKYNEYFRYTNLSEGIGFPYAMNVLITYDEALLNRIEANVMLGNTVEVTNDINAYISKKTQDYDATTDLLTYNDIDTYYQDFVVDGEFDPFYEIGTDKLPLMKFVSKSRQREFFHEGIRWLDIKRLGVEVVHPDFDGNEEILTKEDPRRQLQIPIIAQSLGIEANPR